MVADGGRYRLLEPVRQYAAARLAEAGEEQDAAAAAAAHYRELAAAARAGLHSAEQAERLDRLQVEHANLGATMARLRERGEHAAAARLWASRGTSPGVTGRRRCWRLATPGT